MAGCDAGVGDRSPCELGLAVDTEVTMGLGTDRELALGWPPMEETEVTIGLGMVRGTGWALIMGNCCRCPAATAA